MKKTSILDDTLLLNAELTAAQQRTVQRRVANGELFRIRAGVATSIGKESEWPALLSRNLTRIVAAFAPQSVLSFNTWFTGGRTVRGEVHLVGEARKTVRLPGLTLQVWQGAPCQPGDVPMSGRPVYFASQERGLLENLWRNVGSRAAGKAGVEEKLLEICDARGEKALNQLRDQARAIAPALGRQAEMATLENLIGAILSTRSPAHLLTDKAKARRAVPPYDSDRMGLFETLAAHLRSTEFPRIPSVARSDAAKRHFAFLESYFSNFIEGTEFEVSEARSFVLQGAPIEHRPKDSHDIIGVYEQCLSPSWSTLTLPIGEPVLQQLQDRHALQMKYRPEVAPGAFKLKANQAGNSAFVLPGLVRGTLIEGSKLLAIIPEGLARALFSMFLVAEVHPFDDGNGRLARLVMNAALTLVDECRIIIPTLYRETYLDCLRRLTREADPVPFVKAMTHIQSWTSRFDYEDMDQVIAAMQSCNAFERSLTQYKLNMPASRE